MSRVLLIEDDDAQRYVAAFALRRAGHEVVEAPDGPTGLVAAQQHRPDAIVCDVMMPGMTGYEVVAALRNEPDIAATPVVLLTAMSDRKHMRQGMVAGADDYLTKPYKPDELIEAVTAALTKRQSQHEAFLGSVSGLVEDALEEQKERLGRRYEHQLAQELNQRWERNADSTGDVEYQRAVLLIADLLGPLTSGPDVALRVKRTQQQARDTLYLFGADHVLPYGTDLLAVYATGGSVSTSVELRAARAAFALVKAQVGQPVAIGLHVGPVSLIGMHDSLHGDSGHAIVPGDSIDRVSGLRDIARSEGWRVAVSRELASELHPQFKFDRQGQTLGGDEAYEMQAPK